MCSRGKDAEAALFLFTKAEASDDSSSSDLDDSYTDLSDLSDAEYDSNDGYMNDIFSMEESEEESSEELFTSDSDEDIPYDGDGSHPADMHADYIREWGLQIIEKEGRTYLAFADSESEEEGAVKVPLSHNTCLASDTESEDGAERELSKMESTNETEVVPESPPTAKSELRMFDHPASPN